MNKGKYRICPDVRAVCIDNGTRRWLQNPQKKLKPGIDEGMAVLDLGCGSGFFSMTWKNENIFMTRLKACSGMPVVQLPSAVFPGLLPSDESYFHG
jgi:hypothetical protein